MPPSETLLIEPFGGLAGDMFLAALLDLQQESLGLEDLRRLGASLVPEAFELTSQEVRRGSLRATALHVRTPETGADAPPLRHLSDLVRLVEASSLSAPGQRRALAILTRLAEAESRVHGIALEQVHFHEVGAVDTLIDVCGAVFALERLRIRRVVCTTPYVGGGSVRCAHGEMPVPAPGTAELLRGLPQRVGVGGERLTPTGAALLAELVDEFLVDDDASQAWTTRAIGYGAGQRDPDAGPPNLVRVSLGAAVGPAERQAAWLLECNLDDATPEEVGFLIQELRRNGALEVWSTAVQMKKDRAAVIVAALSRPAQRAGLEELCFRHSPTLGVRWTCVERSECPRESIDVPISLAGLAGVEGSVRVKVRLRPGSDGPDGSDVSPEFDDLAALARSTGRPLRELEEHLRRAALAAWRAAGAVPPE